jgi:nicotinamidase-related amidase
MTNAHLAETDRAVLVVIDMQQRMMSAIHEHESVTMAASKMLRAAAVLGVPVLHTEQNPAGLGETIEPVRAHLPAETRTISKVTCSCWGDTTFRQQLIESNREHVLLVGVEAHVCIQQTALDLLRVDYVPFVLADAVGSRREDEKSIALERMRSAGVIVTSAEAMIFELVRRCDAPQFRAILDIVR